jgi:phospholipid/cholesterol/gamma-HCH transport system substrate-binding protein
MDHERKIETAVGLFVCIAGIILVLGILWGRDARLFRSRRFVQIRFETLQGLKKGDPVTIRGIPQGKVEAVVLKPGHAEIRVGIEKSASLFSDAVFMIQSRELMGGKQVVVYPGQSGLPLDESFVQQGRIGSDPILLLGRAEKSLSTLDSLIRQFPLFRESQRIGRIVEHLDQAVVSVKSLADETRGPLRSSVRSFEKAAVQIADDSLMTRAKRAIVRMDSAAVVMHRVLASIENEDGTLGRLVQDKALYDQLIRSSRSVDSLLADIKANPRKYLHISLF